MSESPAPRRPSQGVFWRTMTAGDPVGNPLAQWAYLTPRFPAGITAFDVRSAGKDVQRETALFWFFSNLQPYDLGGGPWFTFDAPGRGFGQTPFAPSPSLDPRELQRAILARLDHLAAALQMLAPSYGGIGHNGPPPDEPLTEEERVSALAAIEQAKSGVAADDRGGAAVLMGTWSSISPVVEKLGVWALKRVDDFGTEFAKAAGRSMGEKLPTLILTTTAAAAIWHEWKTISELLRHFAM